MKLGIFDDGASGGATIDQMVANAESARVAGFDHYWLPQIFGFESLSVLAIIGREVPEIGLGTAVVPTYPRHPVTMAAEALTVQAASGGRLTLGIGLSHQIVIENVLGMSFDRPARHMREYLSALLPLIDTGNVSFQGETLSAQVGLTVKESSPCPVLIAGLGPKMLELAGGMAAGTVTWMTGPKTLEEHIVPSIRSAAKAAGRDEPRVVAALPVAVTSDEAGARAKAAEIFQMYGFLPSYRAMLDREGAGGPEDVALVGSAAQISEQILALADVGVTDFVAVEYFRGDQVAEDTRALLVDLVGKLK